MVIQAYNLVYFTGPVMLYVIKNYFFTKALSDLKFGSLFKIFVIYRILIELLSNFIGNVLNKKAYKFYFLFLKAKSVLCGILMAFIILQVKSFSSILTPYSWKGSKCSIKSDDLKSVASGYILSSLSNKNKIVISIDTSEKALFRLNGYKDVKLIFAGPCVKLIGIDKVTPKNTISEKHIDINGDAVKACFNKSLYFDSNELVSFTKKSAEFFNEEVNKLIVKEAASLSYKSRFELLANMFLYYNFLLNIVFPVAVLDYVTNIIPISISVYNQFYAHDSITAEYKAYYYEIISPFHHDGLVMGLMTILRNALIMQILYTSKRTLTHDKGALLGAAFIEPMFRTEYAKMTFSQMRWYNAILNLILPTRTALNRQKISSIVYHIIHKPEIITQIVPEAGLGNIFTSSIREDILSYAYVAQRLSGKIPMEKIQFNHLYLKYIVFGSMLAAKFSNTNQLMLNKMPIATKGQIINTFKKASIISTTDFNFWNNIVMDLISNQEMSDYKVVEKYFDDHNMQIIVGEKSMEVIKKAAEHYRKSNNINKDIQLYKADLINNRIGGFITIEGISHFHNKNNSLFWNKAWVSKAYDKSLDQILKIYVLSYITDKEMQKIKDYADSVNVENPDYHIKLGKGAENIIEYFNKTGKTGQGKIKSYTSEEFIINSMDNFYEKDSKQPSLI